MSNTIAISGRLGKDSERKQVGQTTLLEFSVGDSVGFGDKKPQTGGAVRFGANRQKAS